MRARFGDTPERILTAYNPSNQIQFCRDIDRVHFGNAPSIIAVANAYGRNTAASWLEIQINDLSEFAGCREKLTTQQTADTAQLIIEAYPTYKLTEFMLFFLRFKCCKYGRFYGAVDPMIIMQSLSVFADERAAEIDRHEHELRDAEQQREQQQHDALRDRYKRRVPNAFSRDAPINFLQYRLMGFDYMTDDELSTALSDIAAGRRTIPDDARSMLKTIQQTFNINENE